MHYTENDNKRIRGYFDEKFLNISPGNLVSLNQNAVPEETKLYIEEIISIYKLKEFYHKDLFFFACYHIIDTISQTDDFFKMNQQYLSDKKNYAKIFNSNNEDYLGCIESISVKINGINRTIRFDRNKDYRILDKITHKLYLLSKQLEKEPPIIQPISTKSKTKIYIQNFHWMYKYLYSEIKVPKIKVCYIISQFIESMGYSFDYLSQNPEHYIYNIMKNT